MESLLANYGSDDEEESLPQPTRSSIAAYIPPPKLQDPSSNGPSPRSSLFASLPRPKLASENTIKTQYSVSQYINERSVSDAKPISINRDSVVGEIKISEADDRSHGVNKLANKGSEVARRSFNAPPSDGVYGASATRVPLFSTLPPPRNVGSSVVPVTSQKPSGSSVKRVVELRPPINMALLEDDDDDNVKSSVKRLVTENMIGSRTSGLAAILPKPKNLGSALGSGYGSGHQATLDVRTSATSPPLALESTLGSGYGSDQHVVLDVGASVRSDFVPHSIPDSSFMSHEHSSETWSEHANLNSGHGSSFGAWEGYDVGTGSQDQLEAAQQNAAFSDSYMSSHGAEEAADDQSQFYAPEAYTEDLAPCSIPMASSQDALAEFLRREKRKGSKNALVNIVEVKQEDLTATKLREDQLRTTGIAFGPAYKPASSSKGKPSKLHRRKHQIGSLYYDMKQKEMELIERRAKGYMTKAETQAKYGW